MTLLLVLLMICVTLGLSYAAVRSQHTGLQVQRNAGRRVSARQAAVTGLTMAIQKMHTDAWAGVDTTLTGSLGTDESFEVSYDVGDPSLDSEHPDHEDFPYRVTLTSTGYATDPANPAVTATYTIRAVMRLVPRALPDEPSDWSTMQHYTLFQTKKDDFKLNIPFRIEGRVRIQGKLEMATDYPDGTSPWRRYLQDLYWMWVVGYPDYRPFDGPVDFPFYEQDGENFLALTGRLIVPVNHVPVDEVAADWVRPTFLSEYQIYEGGPTYTIPAVDATLENTLLEPDPLTNPLGIYYRDGTVEIMGNVTVRGSLFCKDDIKIKGENVHFLPVELPALYGTDAPVRLPVASCEDFVVESDGGGDLTGLLAVFDDYRIKEGPDTVAFAVEGRVVTRELIVEKRQPWDGLGWGSLYDDFEEQLHEDDDPIPYFPVYVLEQEGCDPAPLLTIKPDSAEITYHWHYPGDRIFESDPDDDGLRWDLIEWTENP